jgi:hypothetical protein
VLKQPHPAPFASFSASSYPFSRCRGFSALRTIVNDVCLPWSLVRIRSSMNYSDKEAHEAGTSPFRILNTQRSDDHARYTARAEHTANPSLRNVTGPSWSASSGPRQMLASIQTECPLSEAQQEPLSPSSGDFPALTPSHSQSTFFSDRSTGLFGGLQEDPSLDETGSISDLARRRGFSGTFSTSLASRSLNGADGPGLSAQNGLATQDGPEEHMLVLPKITEHREPKCISSPEENRR